MGWSRELKTFAMRPSSRTCSCLLALMSICNNELEGAGTRVSQRLFEEISCLLPWISGRNRAWKEELDARIGTCMSLVRAPLREENYEYDHSHKEIPSMHLCWLWRCLHLSLLSAEDLEPACLHGDSTYEDRKAARSAEVQALKQAQVSSMMPEDKRRKAIHSIRFELYWSLRRS